jgi:hypothetical protein
MHIYFLDLAQLKDLLPPMQIKSKKGATKMNTSLTNFSLQQLKYLDAYTNMPMCSYTSVPMLFGA